MLSILHFSTHQKEVSLFQVARSASAQTASHNFSTRRLLLRRGHVRARNATSTAASHVTARDMTAFTPDIILATGGTADVVK